MTTEIEPTLCAWCGATGQIQTGWDEDGNDIFAPCSECNKEENDD